MRLAGKTALITGAARGIGQACARVLASAGAAVAVADVLPLVEQTAEGIRAEGGRAAAAVFDVADPAQVRRGVAALREALGPIHVLVNNAGIVNNVAAVGAMSHEAWEREIGTNLSGSFNAIQQVIGDMVAGQWGRIVNISSIGAVMGMHRQIGYAASKAGLLGMTKTVALEHAQDGITCNAVMPGLIETENVRRMPEEIKRRVLALTPARRFGKMEEVAQLVLFLASDEAAFINGTEISIDGGLRLNPVSLGSRKAQKEI